MLPTRCGAREFYGIYFFLFFSPRSRGVREPTVAAALLYRVHLNVISGADHYVIWLRQATGLTTISKIWLGYLQKGYHHLPECV